MQRRDFLKKTTLATIGGLLIPSTLISSCSKETLFETSNYSGKVIIIGAGASGLYAAYILKSKGIDFTLLEASETYGGRMGKLTGFCDYTIDIGAQWMHGNNSILADLVRYKKIPHTLDESELSYLFNGQIVKNLPKDPYIFEDENLPDISFIDYAHQQNFGTEYDGIIEAIAGDQGAAANQISAYWNSKDEENWVAGDDDFKFLNSYFDLIDEHIAKPVIDNIIFNCQVTSIDYLGEKIKITNSQNTVFEADKLIVTVPISILKLNEITFNPTLPIEKTEAFSKFGMGPGMKVFFKFQSKFYEDILIGASICGAYLDDTVGKQTNDHILLAFIMGNQAANLHGLGNENAIVSALLEELDSIYNGQASSQFIAAKVFDYSSKPFIKGAYGFSTIGMGNARETAAQPIENKLFFAGEAMNTNGHHQTVHGAVESGYMAVIDLLNSLDQ
jgi:lysine-specific histone demethylase 1B